MKIGDKKQDKVVQFSGNQKKDVLAVFEQLTQDDQEEKLLELERKRLQT